MGFKADVIIWDFSKRALYCRLTLHMVKVQAVAFSPNDQFLASLGGQDDNRSVSHSLSAALMASPLQQQQLHYTSILVPCSAQWPAHSGG